MLESKSVNCLVHAIRFTRLRFPAPIYFTLLASSLPLLHKRLNFTLLRFEGLGLVANPNANLEHGHPPLITICFTQLRFPTLLSSTHLHNTLLHSPLTNRTQRQYIPFHRTLLPIILLRSTLLHLTLLHYYVSHLCTSLQSSSLCSASPNLCF